MGSSNDSNLCFVRLVCTLAHMLLCRLPDRAAMDDLNKQRQTITSEHERLSSELYSAEQKVAKASKEANGHPANPIIHIAK